MQHNKLSLNRAQGLLDLSTRKVRVGCNKQTSKLYSCKLGCNKIIADNGLSTDADFETGVAKIQQGVVLKNKMTLEERNACKILLKSSKSLRDSASDTDSEESEEDITMAIATKEKRKLKEIEGQSNYINCSFVIGSAAIVE